MVEKSDAGRLEETIQQELKPLKLSNAHNQQEVENITRCIRPTGEIMLKIGEVFKSEMEKGIRDEPSSLLMENTYVPELVNGTEHGKFLALDLGGTNFRVIMVEISNGHTVKESVEQFHISDEMKVGPGEELFDYLAECVSVFVNHHNVADDNLPLGFTFSFPMHQRSLDVGLLVTWTKTFTASNVEGRDVVRMLNESLDKKGVKVQVVAILNDTTGALIYGSSLDNNTVVGLILGTGSNACYLERADRVTHWESERHGEKEVLIDIEWGAFGDNGTIDFIKTDFDRKVDINSLITNSFTFEKYIAGKYLGEVVRVVLVELINNKVLFNGNASEIINTPQKFLTTYVSHIEQDNIDNRNVETEKVLKTMGIDSYTSDDIEIVKFVCELCSLRAAVLVSSCLAALLQRVDKPEMTVAVDGSLYKKHPRFKMWMYKFISLLAPEVKFHLMLAEDGSGKGAALTAAIATRLRRRNSLL